MQPLVDSSYMLKRSNSQTEFDFLANMGPNLLDLYDPPIAPQNLFVNHQYEHNIDYLLS